MTQNTPGKQAGSPCALVWFRQDLRLGDNPALTAAVKTGLPILPVYILDDATAGHWKTGAASRVWLHHSLRALDSALGHNLLVVTGDAETILPHLARDSNAAALFWNRCYEPLNIARDTRLKASLRGAVEVFSFNGSLLYEPWDVLKDDGTPYRVFTPFYRRGIAEKGTPPQPLPAPEITSFARLPHHGGPDSMALLPRTPRWDEKIMTGWQVGEHAAQTRLHNFIADGLKGYKEGRDRPGLSHVSRLSPHLRWGEISPRQVWHAIHGAMLAAQGDLDNDGDTFLKEVGWREFSYNLLYHNPDMPAAPLQHKFARFPWRDDDANLRRWQEGRTGYPIVDAGMRELWETGYMHNRVRMIVASFLVKDLLIHWRQGANWFWDTLLDADLANNSASWQWVAGCGADAAPYFRIFNPVTQSIKFDPSGTYIRRYLPELRSMPDTYIHAPFQAPPLWQSAAYPRPCVDHDAARKRALAALASTKDDA